MQNSFVFYFHKWFVTLPKDLPRTTLHSSWPWKILTLKDSKNLHRIFNPSLSRHVFMRHVFCSTPTNCWQFHLKLIHLRILMGIWTLMVDHWSRKKLKVKIQKFKKNVLIHIFFKMHIFSKFTFFQSSYFYKIHIFFKINIFSKFTFFKIHIF